MFVYKKNTLKKEIVPVRGDEASMHLIHEPSGVHIKFNFLTDTEADIETAPNTLSMNGAKVNMTTPYIIYKPKPDNSYLFYTESYDSKKDLTQNFKDAIDIFEQRIFEQLNETEPTPTNEQAEPPQNQEQFSALPEVGDFVKVGSRFGRVVDVDEATRMVKIDKMTEKEVMDILRRQKNESQEQSSNMSATMQNMIDDLLGEEKFDDGGITIMNEGFFVVQVDEQGANLTILRIQPPSEGGQGEQGEPQGEGEQTPDNVEDPFQDQGSDGEGEGDGEGGESQEGQDGDQGGDQGGDQEGDESGDQEDDQEGGEGGTEGGGQGSSDDKSEDGKKGEGFREWTPNDDEFGDDDFFSEEDLQDALNDVKEKLDGKKKEQEDEKTMDDLRQVANFLSLTEQNIFENFMTKKELQAVIGGRRIFMNDNDERVKNVIDLIFRKK